MKRLYELAANVIPESVPLIVQGIGNAMGDQGTKVYASGVALNGAVGLSEIVRAGLRLRQDRRHVPSMLRVVFGLLNLGSAATYGVSQLLGKEAKTIASATGAIVQGLSYVGIIVTHTHIVVEDAVKLERSRAEEAVGISSAVSSHSGQNVPRRRRVPSSATPPRPSVAPQLPMPDFGEPGLGLG